MDEQQHDPRLLVCTDGWGEPPPQAAKNKLPAHPSQAEPAAWEKATQYTRDQLDREWRYKLKRHIRYCVRCRTMFQQYMRSKRALNGRPRAALDRARRDAVRIVAEDITKRAIREIEDEGPEAA